jgi:hypothetical protein
MPIKECHAEDCPGTAADYPSETTWKHDAYWGSIIAAFIVGAVLVAGLWVMQPKYPDPARTMTYEIILRMPGDGTAVLQPSMEIIWPKKIPGRE